VTPFPLGDDESMTLYEAVIDRFVVGSDPRLEGPGRKAFPTPESLFSYYAYVAETDTPEADLKSIANSYLTAVSRKGQPLHPLFTYWYYLGTDPLTASPWARTFLPRRRGIAGEVTPAVVAYGKTRLMMECGVDVGYATGLFNAYSGDFLPAERIIELWHSGVPQEYAQELMVE
jgi:hypothetical protein